MRRERGGGLKKNYHDKITRIRGRNDGMSVVCISGTNIESRLSNLDQVTQTLACKTVTDQSIRYT